MVSSDGMGILFVVVWLSSIMTPMLLWIVVLMLLVSRPSVARSVFLLVLWWHMVWKW